MLLAEPDELIATSILDAAQRRGIRAEWCRDGAETLLSFGASQPDVLVIAARLPIIAAEKVIEIVRRRWKRPVLIGVGPNDEDAARIALHAGASAVVARPYEIEPIFALGLGLNARGTDRLNTGTDPNPDAALLVAGPITIDRRRHETRVRGREVLFTLRELELLIYLVQQRGQVASPDEIMSAVWRRPVDTNTVAVHVKRLRDKLGDDPQHGQMIRTVRGVGYRLAPSLCTDAQPNAR